MFSPSGRNSSFFDTSVNSLGPRLTLLARASNESGVGKTALKYKFSTNKSLYEHVYSPKIGRIKIKERRDSACMSNDNFLPPTICTPKYLIDSTQLMLSSPIRRMLSMAETIQNRHKVTPED